MAHTDTTETVRPLDGIRVLELSHLVAGPTTGLIFSELGADVVKIEPVRGGDQFRAEANNVYAYLNRNKRSLAIDLKSARGRSTFLELVRKADVVVDNFGPGVVDRLGIGYEELSQVNPGVITLSIRGFLPGPYENRAALDELAQMSGGLAFMTGPTGRPMRAGASIVDIGAAKFGVIGVLAALVRRGTTGKGQKITSALFETVVFWEGSAMLRAATSGEPSRPFAETAQALRMGWGVYDLFDTADGEQVFIGVTSDAHWERFCRALGQEDLLAEPELATNRGRALARDRVVPLLRERLSGYTSAQLQDLLVEANVPVAPMQRPDQLFTDPHLQGSGGLVAVPVPLHGDTNLPRVPLASSDFTVTGVDRPAPGHGEHTVELLKEIGCGDDEIATMARAGEIRIGSDLAGDWTAVRNTHSPNGEA